VKVEVSVPLSQLVDGYTKKHFTELSLTGICTCICPACSIPAIRHVRTEYKPGKVLCVVKE